DPMDAADWDRLIAHIRPDDIVIVSGDGSGPGVGIDAVLAQRFASVHATGAIVLGYVNYPAGTTTQTAEADIDKWKDFYAPSIDGIFLDQSDRASDADLAQFRALRKYVDGKFVDGYGQGGWLLYNFGLAYQKRNYVDCLIHVGSPNAVSDRSLFVTQESHLVDYLSQANINQWRDDPEWNWVNNYYNMHFVHLVHDVPLTNQAQIQADTQMSLAKARGWNASGFYATDGLFAGDTW